MSNRDELLNEINALAAITDELKTMGYTLGQVADLMAGKWYANIHTAKFPGGEIRGQMTARP